jgi:hypothetical protein
LAKDFEATIAVRHQLPLRCISHAPDQTHGSFRMR